MYQSVVLHNKTQTYSDFLKDYIWNLLDQTYSLPDRFDFNTFYIDKEKYIGRPDLISIDAYGDPIFADVICKLNGISNPFELNVGMSIIVPSPSDVMNFAHFAPVQEMDSGEGDDKIIIKPKTKSQKRKANEAIVGDKRFKIDSTKGIVIY